MEKLIITQNDTKKKIVLRREIFIENEINVDGEKKILSKNQSLYYLKNNIMANKLAIFDLDNTLIETLSGKIYSESSKDWKFLYDSTIQTLKNYNDQGYKIIVVSNQYGLSNGTLSSDLLTEKINHILSLIEIPMEFYIASQKDSFRKPMTDIWDQIVSNNMIDPLSFYCGDAAGRNRDYIVGKKKDFNITDRYFAHNINCNFYTPEEIFLGLSPFKYTDIYLSEINLEKYYPISQPKIFPNQEINVIIMVGPQASGKTTLSKNISYANYIYLNNDIIKNPQKLKNLYNKYLKEKKNIILDNTNPCKESRKYYIDLAKNNGYNVYCYFFDFPKIISFHLNNMRLQITHGEQKLIPKIAIHTFYKKLVKPCLDEGLTEIIVIDRLHLPIINMIEFDRYYYYHYDLNN